MKLTPKSHLSPASARILSFTASSQFIVSEKDFLHSPCSVSCQKQRQLVQVLLHLRQDGFGTRPREGEKPFSLLLTLLSLISFLPPSLASLREKKTRSRQFFGAFCAFAAVAGTCMRTPFAALCRHLPPFAALCCFR